MSWRPPSLCRQRQVSMTRRACSPSTSRAFSHELPLHEMTVSRRSHFSSIYTRYFLLLNNLGACGLFDMSLPRKRRTGPKLISPLYFLCASYSPSPLLLTSHSFSG